MLGRPMRLNTVYRLNSLLVNRRFLGNSARGPPLDDIPGNFNEAKKIFYKQHLSHSELQQTVESLRIFLFWGIVSFCTFDLIINPLKSNYWNHVISLKYLSNLFWNNQTENVFHTSKADEDGNTDAWRQYIKLYK